MLCRLRTLLPTDSWCRALLAPTIVFIATAIDRSFLTDFWHHLARGRAIAEHGQIVNQDIFTYTVAGQPFQDNNWLTQLLYYWLYQNGGLNLVVVVNSATLAVVVGILVWLCRRASGAPILASAMGILAFLGMWQILIIRPQTFSLLLFVVLYALLLNADRRRWLLSFPPLIMALWVNLHGGFPIGLVLVGAFLAAAALQGYINYGRHCWRDGHLWALATCLVLCVLATSVNPYGWNIYRYVVTTSSTAAQRRIDEWVPPGLDLLIGKIFILSLVLLIGLFGLARRRPTVREVCLVACFLPLACGSVRMVAWWLLVTTPILAALLAESFPSSMAEGSKPEVPTVSAAAFCGILLMLAILSLPCLERWSPLNAVRGTHRDEMDLEEIAVGLPSSKGQCRIFSRFEWGEYLGWRLAPHGLVFMDGRIEIFPDKVWGEYTAVTTASADWQAVLDEYSVDYLCLDSDYHHNLIRHVEDSGRWQLVNTAGKAMLFERVETVPKPALHKDGLAQAPRD
jgi:hypothetical protein